MVWEEDGDGDDDVDDDDEKKMQTLFSLLFAFVCEVGGRRVCAGREKQAEGSGRCPDVEKGTVYTCVAIWGLLLV